MKMVTSTFTLTLKTHNVVDFFALAFVVGRKTFVIGISYVLQYKFKSAVSRDWYAHA